MVVIGKTDQFEHMYKEKFRAFAAQFGHFVSYERDIATRDLGLHLTQPLKTGGVIVTSCLSWFQMKGIMPKTLPKEKAERATSFHYRLKVDHLRFWFLQPMPTYLALYVGALDSFYILNLQKYVEDTWGKDILTLEQKTVDIEIPRTSRLDEEALRLILRESTIEEWGKAMSAEKSQVRLCQRDYNLIWRIGTAGERKVEHRAEIFDWQSKTRGEIHFEERALSGGDWEIIRNHWQLMLSVDHVEDAYPYLDFSAKEEAEERSEYGPDEDDDHYFPNVWGNDDDYEPRFRLRNGQLAAGRDCAGEYHLYYFLLELNEFGRDLFKLIDLLLKIKFIEIAEDGPSEFISVAPWHSRHV